MRLAGVPAMVMHPDWKESSASVRDRPWLLWMHGRSVTKEIDPGRFLRCVRDGIACVAVDLPGHGERLDEAMQAPEQTLRVIDQMRREIDAVVDAAQQLDGFGHERVAVGGMSAGGMTTLARLCEPHRFTCAVVECTTGSWRWQPNLRKGEPTSDGLTLAALDPISHLDHWRPIPLLILHNRRDEWVPLEGMEEFVEALRANTASDAVTLHVYEETGAPFEHAGFGRMGADAKDRVVAFLVRHLREDARG